MLLSLCSISVQKGLQLTHLHTRSCDGVFHHANGNDDRGVVTGDGGVVTGDGGVVTGDGGVVHGSEDGE